MHACPLLHPHLPATIRLAVTSKVHCGINNDWTFSPKFQGYRSKVLCSCSHHNSSYFSTTCIKYFIPGGANYQLPIDRHPFLIPGRTSSPIIPNRAVSLVAQLKAQLIHSYIIVDVLCCYNMKAQLTLLCRTGVNIVMLRV